MRRLYRSGQIPKTTNVTDFDMLSLGREEFADVDWRGLLSGRRMPDAAINQGAADPHCRSCQAEINAGDRFCRACGAGLMPDCGRPPATGNKNGRTIAAIMFLSGIAIMLFAAVHRNPADLILVVGFALPLCGAGALGWRTK